MSTNLTGISNNNAKKALIKESIKDILNTIKKDASKYIYSITGNNEKIENTKTLTNYFKLIHQALTGTISNSDKINKIIENSINNNTITNTDDITNKIDKIKKNNPYYKNFIEKVEKFKINSTASAAVPAVVPANPLVPPKTNRIQVIGPNSNFSITTPLQRIKKTNFSVSSRKLSPEQTTSSTSSMATPLSSNPSGQGEKVEDLFESIPNRINPLASVPGTGAELAKVKIETASSTTSTSQALPMGTGLTTASTTGKNQKLMMQKKPIRPTKLIGRQTRRITPVESSGRAPRSMSNPIRYGSVAETQSSTVAKKENGSNPTNIIINPPISAGTIQKGNSTRSINNAYNNQGNIKINNKKYSYWNKIKGKFIRKKRGPLSSATTNNIINTDDIQMTSNPMKQLTGAPAKFQAAAQGAPAKSQAAQGAPAKSQAAQGAPAKSQAAQGAPEKSQAAQGAPEKSQAAAVPTAPTPAVEVKNKNNNNATRKNMRKEALLAAKKAFNSFKSVDLIKETVGEIRDIVKARTPGVAAAAPATTSTVSSGGKRRRSPLSRKSRRGASRKPLSRRRTRRNRRSN
jgi:hypothetical protein